MEIEMTKEQLRIEGAKAALTGILSNNCLIGYTGVLEDVVEDAVGYGVLFAEKLWAIREEEVRRDRREEKVEPPLCTRQWLEDAIKASGPCLTGSPDAPDHP